MLNTTERRIRYSARTRISRLAALIIVWVLAGTSFAAEVITVSGHGEASVRPGKKKETASLNQEALGSAQASAQQDAIAQALYKVYGSRDKLGPDGDKIINETANHSASWILETQVRTARIDGSTALVEVVARIDGSAFRSYLEDAFGRSLARDTEGQFRVYVLSFTVEGMDPNRTAPTVLREETTDDRKNVQASASSNDTTRASTASQASSLQGSLSESTKANAAASAKTSVDYSGSASGSIKGKSSSSENAFGKDVDGSGRYGHSASESVDGKLQASEKLKGDSTASATASLDHKLDAAVDQRSSQSKSSYNRDKASQAMYGDTSTYYHKLVIYADPTKKGAGNSNEIRAKLEEMLKTAGLDTRLKDLNLMGRDFENEDDLIHTILAEVKTDPDIAPGDYVGIALNRFTPLAVDDHRFSSSVTYRLVRVRDGHELVPSKNVVADSGSQASDDIARTVATELALKKVDEILPGEISRGVKGLQREADREAAAGSAAYTLRVDNVSSPLSTKALKEALRQNGFGAKPSFRGDSRSETTEIALAGKSSADVMAILEPLLADYEVVSMDDHGTVLRAK